MRLQEWVSGQTLDADKPHLWPERRFMALVHESKLTATIPTTDTSPADGVRVWPAQFGHRVQDVARELRFCRSPIRCPGSKTVADDRLIPEERVLDAGLLMVA